MYLRDCVPKVDERFSDFDSDSTKLQTARRSCLAVLANI